MTATALFASVARPTWLIPMLGVAWNGFGINQFITMTTASREQLVAMGLTPDQAALYAGLPGWMTLAFAVGVFGGFAGSALLGLRRKAAIPVLMISLFAYLVLFVGDITAGVFAAFGLEQVIILTTVLVIATFLFVFALQAGKRDLV